MSREAIRSLLERWTAEGRRVVHEADTKRVLAMAGIRVPERDPVSGPTAVKLASDRFPHKTEHGLVRLGIDAARAAETGAGMRDKDPAGKVLVEAMVSGAVAEWIVGCKHDVTFGPIVLAGPGGTLVEVIDEVEIRLAPASAATAGALLEGRVSRTLLAGTRGNPPADTTALANLIASLSAVFADHADLIREIEVNPVMVLPDGAVAADALMILNAPEQGEAQ